VREARNGGEFLDHVAQQTGLTARVITGAEEGRLIFLGVRNSIALPDQPTLVVDIGGGSVEMIVGNRDQIFHVKSLKLGAIRLKDLYLTKTPPAKGMLKQLETAVAGQLKSALASFRTKRIEQTIATSGMAANLAEVIYLKRTGRPLPQLNLAKISLTEIAQVESRLARSTLKARLASPGLDPKRVDTLLPTAVVFRTLLQLIQKQEVTLCDKAIREGLIYDFIQRHREGIQAEHDIPDVRKRNVLALARRCHSSEIHALHVAGLALRLFDQTKSLHGYGPREREWLEFAAILHDIGYVINPRQHHKHAYYLIKHSDLSGLTADEVDIIANLARYHRRALPAKKHGDFSSMPAGSQRIVKVLGSLLRIADALDRSQFSVVQTLDVALGKTLTIRLHVAGEAELEIWAARGRADLFESVFQRSVQFEVAASKEGAA
jgi:exopolyphosphatase/guanosine-5'-triphosphate,3'-diphosphate pyrophosphatase